MLSQRLKSARKNRGYRQEDLARLVKVTKGTISNYENGYSTPSNDMLVILADALGITTDYLLGRGTSNESSQPAENNFNPIKELNRLFDKYEVEDAGFLDIDKWKEMTPEDLRSLEDYFEYLYTKSKNSKHKDKDHEEVDDL